MFKNQILVTMLLFNVIASVDLIGMIPKKESSSQDKIYTINIELDNPQATSWKAIKDAAFKYIGNSDSNKYKDLTDTEPHLTISYVGGGEFDTLRESLLFFTIDQAINTFKSVYGSNALSSITLDKATIFVTSQDGKKFVIIKPKESELLRGLATTINSALASNGFIVPFLKLKTHVSLGLIIKTSPQMFDLFKKKEYTVLEQSLNNTFSNELSTLTTMISNKKIDISTVDLTKKPSGQKPEMLKKYSLN